MCMSSYIYAAMHIPSLHAIYVPVVACHVPGCMPCALMHAMHIPGCRSCDMCPGYMACLGPARLFALPVVAGPPHLHDLCQAACQWQHVSCRMSSMGSCLVSPQDYCLSPPILHVPPGVRACLHPATLASSSLACMVPQGPSSLGWSYDDMHACRRPPSAFKSRVA
jgi:hypothetical protein